MYDIHALVVPRRGNLLVRSLVLVASFAIAACSDSTSSECKGDLAQVGRGCPQTFDGTEAQLPPCSASEQRVTMCGNLIRLSTSHGYGGLDCYFDSSSHGLVGAEQVTDIPDFCGGTSFTLPAGTVGDTACKMATPSIQRFCNGADAGTE
jgi:hypothetical protein